MRLFPLALLAGLAGCFNTTDGAPVCAFAGDPTNGNHCPDGYTFVATDGFCHRNDSINTPCPFPTADMTAVPDMSMHDMSLVDEQPMPGPDMTGDATLPPGMDMTSQPDATVL